MEVASIPFVTMDVLDNTWCQIRVQIAWVLFVPHEDATMGNYVRSITTTRVYPLLPLAIKTPTIMTLDWISMSP